MAILSADRRYWRWFLIILASGFALRLAWALAVQVSLESDSVVYDQLAWNLATHGAYAWDSGDLTAYWPVGTAFVYSLIYRLFGHSPEAIAALNVLIGTMSIALIMALGRRWFSETTAIAAGAIAALWPSQIEFTSVLASELLFNFALLLSLWAASAVPIRSWWMKGLLAGGVLAGAAFVRPTALLLPALLVAALLWTRVADWRAITRFTVAAIVTMAICITPWALRNMRELGAPVLISTNGAANFWMGNNPDSTGAYMPLPGSVAELSEVDRSKLLGDRARHFILDQPGRAALLFANKLLITHDRETIGVVWNEGSLRPALGDFGIKATKAASTAYWWLVLALGCLGGFSLIARAGWRALYCPALMAWGYFAFVHAVTVGADRYHFPSIPFIAMLAGYALTLARRRRFDTLAVGRA